MEASDLVGGQQHPGSEINRIVGKPLSSRSINMTLKLLAAILETAVERDRIARNPANGEGRRARERAPRRSYLDTAAQIESLLAAAAELDRDAPGDKRHVRRKAMLATLTFAGIRIGELRSLRWGDVDLACGWPTVGESNTDAGRRRVRIRGALRDELSTLRADVTQPESRTKAASERSDL